MKKNYRDYFEMKERNFVAKHAQRSGAGAHGRSAKAQRRKDKIDLKKRGIDGE